MIWQQHVTDPAMCWFQRSAGAVCRLRRARGERAGERRDAAAGLHRRPRLRGAQQRNQSGKTPAIDSKLMHTNYAASVLRGQWLTQYAAVR